MRENKYPNGYISKLKYWGAELSKAINAGKVREMQFAMGKFDYFFERQVEWIKNKS